MKNLILTVIAGSMLISTPCMALEGRLEVDFYVNSGVNHFKLKNYESAVTQFRKALAPDPDLIEAHFQLGAIYDQNGNLSHAASEYQKTLALEAQHVEAHLRLGNMYHAQGLYDEAGLAYQKVLPIAV